MHADSSKTAKPPAPRPEPSTGESLLVQSLPQTFGEEFAAHVTVPCPSSRELVLPRIVDFDPSARRFTYDDRYRLKQPDWTYAA
jgi:hypothetical protein